jgi:hypothetical protein
MPVGWHLLFLEMFLYPYNCLFCLLKVQRTVYDTQSKKEKGHGDLCSRQQTQLNNYCIMRKSFV